MCFFFFFPVKQKLPRHYNYVVLTTFLTWFFLSLSLCADSMLLSLLLSLSILLLSLSILLLSLSILLLSLSILPSLFVLWNKRQRYILLWYKFYSLTDNKYLVIYFLLQLDVLSFIQLISLLWNKSFLASKAACGGPSSVSFSLASVPTIWARLPRCHCAPSITHWASSFLVLFALATHLTVVTKQMHFHTSLTVLSSAPPFLLSSSFFKYVSFVWPILYMASHCYGQQAGHNTP